MEPAYALDRLLVDRGDHHYFAFGERAPPDATERLFDELLRAEATRGGAHRARVLVDIRDARDTGPGSTRTVLRRHREFRGRRVAVVGPTGAQGALVDILIRATGFRDARYFVDEGEAVAWLRAP